MSFVHLHCHSSFSFHAGVPSSGEIVGRAQQLGMPAVGLTDTNRMSGLILHYQACREAGIRPVLGVELTAPGPHEVDKARWARLMREAGDEPAARPGAARGPCEPSLANAPPSRATPSVVLLARNASGYGDLCEITTRRHLEAEDFSLGQVFGREWPDLFIVTAHPQVLELVAAGPNKPHLYGEIVNNSKATRVRSRELAAVARRLGVPLVAGNDCFFLRPEDVDTHRILTAIGLNSTLSRLKPEETASDQAWLRPPEEMERAFSGHEALANAGRIAEQCEVELDLGKWILPRGPVPAGHTPESFLSELAWAGLEANYGHKPRKVYEKARRIQETELQVIERLGYPSYFLIVKEVRDWANARFASGYRKPKDCTILRGSAANSLTFYNIGVSDLDPIRYDLYFQRFLNEERASPPDADLDFGWDERDEVLGFMAERWGRDRVAITCTTNHFRERAAFRETAKVFGYTDDQVTQILQSWKSRTRRVEDEEVHGIWAVAERIKGTPRMLGQHPGGVLITNDPICRHVACEYSGGDKNRVITQVDMHNGTEELGLIKLDILGNGSLSVLRDALAQLEEDGIPDPQVWDLEKCYADERVCDVIRKGRTKGIFYIESPAQTRLNKKAQAQTFKELTITSSLVRPAGSSYTATYVERERQRKMGVKDWDFLHPSLEPILSDTHDVCAFQEDVTKICHQVAGLSYGQADKIRKMMNSQHEGAPADGVWQRTERDFLHGCMRNSGLTAEQALELWQRVSSFSGFSFCKSHSATYAQLSFQCTYLKAHYPAQFLAAVVSNRHGFYRRDVYLNEARRWGVRLLPMDINDSGVKYRGRGNVMRPGMMHVRAVRAKALEALVAERMDSGHFRDLVDFVERVPALHKAEIERLILVGAFDGFGMTQPELLWLLDDVHGTVRADEGMSLFAGTGVLERARQQVPAGLRNYNLAERCLNELELLGYMLSGDILEILDLHPASKGAVGAREVEQYAGRRVKLFGRQVTERMHRVQRTGEPMMFLTLEDKSETVDVILWPDVYERYADVLMGGGPFEVRGRVLEEWGTYSVEADFVRAVEWSPNVVDLELASQRLLRSFEGEYVYGDVAVAAA